MVNDNPIGLFDSGIGGTSIWREIHRRLPSEDTLYLADSLNAPYGEKSKDEILALSEKNTEFLLERNAKLIVVACNTATTNAIKELRSKYKVPFIGIEPAIKPAAQLSNTQKIGVLATRGTLTSELFHKTVETFRDTTIVEQIGHGLVRLIEAGMIDSTEMRELLSKYLQPMIDADVDYLVLGCSHYPYLIPQIKAILPSSITIIDSGEAVAKQTHHVLSTSIGLRAGETGKATFYTNVDPTVLKHFVGSAHEVIQADF